MAVGEELDLTEEQQAALKSVLMDNGDTVELDVDAAGVTREGVKFTCVSDYACTVTVSNSAGTIVATWASQTLGDGTASAMVTGLEPPPETDPFAKLNVGNASSVATILMQAIDAEMDSGPPPVPHGAYGNQDTEVGGLGLGDSGAMDISGVSLKSNLNPNGAVYIPSSKAGTGGSTVTAADDEITTNADTVARSGWPHKVLFRDWGDTASDDDGGFETGALVYSDMMPPTEDVPFDSKLSAMFVNSGASYEFTVRLDGETANAGNGMPADAVAISVGEEATEQTKAMMLTVGAPQLETLVDTVTVGSQHRGTYFGAMGTFRCAGKAPGCGISRAEGGDTPFGVALADSGTIDWVFKPDADATIDVPDQDWLVYGAWLTTPDIAAGTHRAGVFYDGMDEYANANNVFNPNHTGSLHGSATYSGGAAGVYVDGTATGMFTARANLTATFDLNGNGTADAGDGTISGRIDDFMGTDGTYLGTDTAMDPNDPTAGGENDWVVLLSSTAINTNTTSAGAITGSGAAGSVDGVPWMGEWNAQFYGPNTVDMQAVAPTGVAGNFRVVDSSPDATKSVVGGFGAHMMSDDMAMSGGQDSGGQGSAAQ